MIKTTTIETGKARFEGRQPSHDGEYIRIYYTNESAEIIAENNAGAFDLDAAADAPEWLSDEEATAYESEWKAIQEEAYEARRTFGGEQMSHCGSDAKAEMITLGWATEYDFDGNYYYSGISS